MWSKREGEKIINLRGRGLVGIGTVFENYVEKELGKSHAIKNLCMTCLNACFTKRNFTKLLPNDQANELKSKVGRQVCVKHHQY
jgi:predicted amino acid racemase